MIDDSERLENLSNLFKLLGDPTRLKILSSLRPGEKCVHEIAGELGLGQTVVSHHLRHLKSARLVCSRREGKHIFYRLDDRHVEILIEMGLQHIEEG